MTNRRPPSPFGYVTLVCLGVANMIGAGVFTTSGYALAALGSPGRVLLAWGIGGILAMAGAVSYGLLIRAMPMSGGEYLFLSRAMHPAAGFLAGWISLIAGFAGATAIAALAMERYVLGDADPITTLIPRNTIAIGMVIVSAGLHAVRVRVGAGVQNLAVAIKFLMILGLCGVTLARWDSHDWYWEDLTMGTTSWFDQFAIFAANLVWISFSYSGFNAAVYVADEVDEPTETVTRALLHATIIVVVLYMVLNTIFLLSAPAKELAGKEVIAAVAARAIGGAPLDAFVRATISLALATSVLSLMMAGPRVYARMADDQLMPRQFRFAGEAPRAAIALQAAIAIVLMLVWSLRDMLSYLGLTLSLCAAVTVSCLFLPNVRGDYRRTHGVDLLARGAWIAPLLFVAGTLVNATCLAIADSRQWIGTMVTILSGGVLYGVIRKSQSIGDQDPRVP